jgi:hypothetical protein
LFNERKSKGFAVEDISVWFDDRIAQVTTPPELLCVKSSHSSMEEDM